MKTYKLKKWYPSLPKDWEVGMEVSRWGRAVNNIFSPRSSKYKNYYVSFDEINNFEFWEEVIEYPIGTNMGVVIEEIVEKDYEILSFVRNESSLIYKGTIFMKDENNKYNSSYKYSGLTLEHCLKGGFDIHSIKRLSDGEVFTVGDKIIGTYSTKERTHGYVTIQKIYLKNGILHISIDAGFIDSSLCNGFEKINHFKQPLFTTEDGVDIFEGDKVHTVTPNFNLGLSGELKYKSVMKCFSTKEKAEEYVLMNKPSLTYIEVMKLWNSQCSNWRDSFKSELTKLVKSKLL